MTNNWFCTSVNCMDGRVQKPVIEFLESRFSAQYVDTITEPGPARCLADDPDGPCARAIEERIRISVERHGSTSIAVCAHDDCAGNPVDKEQQLDQLARAIERLRHVFPAAEVVGLWIDVEGSVEEIESGRIAGSES